MSLKTDTLNCQFGLNGKIRFSEDDGLIKFTAKSRHSSLQCHLQGAHITSFIVTGSSEILWLSPLSEFKQGKVIRGGIPICWPWFGKPANKPSDSSPKPQHGFARNSLFEVLSTAENDNGELEITLVLNDSEQSLKIWPFRFALNLQIVVGESLSITLTTHNLDSQTMSITEAIHSYFKVDHIDKVALSGLENAKFYDQITNGESQQKEANLKIKQEIDRIYFAPSNALELAREEQVIAEKSTLQRIKIYIEQSNANAVVVWNPWIKKSKLMTDFPDKGYIKMLCIEAANTHVHAIKILAGDSHTIQQVIRLSTLCK